MKACAEFYYGQIAEKFSLKLPLYMQCQTHDHKVETDQYVVFLVFSECLFNQMIQLLAPIA